VSIPKRYSHFIFGLIQSGFTCAIAAAIASVPFMHQWRFHKPLAQVMDDCMGNDDTFVLMATPFIRRAVDLLTGERG
jgi:hypothetical protein